MSTEESAGVLQDQGSAEDASNSIPMVAVSSDAASLIPPPEAILARSSSSAELAQQRVSPEHNVTSGSTTKDIQIGAMQSDSDSPSTPEKSWSGKRESSVASQSESGAADTPQSRDVSAIAATSAHTAQANTSPAMEQRGHSTNISARTLAQQISQQPIESAQLRVQGGVSELKVGVQLPDLGRVEIRAVTNQETTTAHITAQRQDALPVLASGRSALEEALRSHDVTLTSLNAQAQGQSNQRQSQETLYIPSRVSGLATSQAETNTLPQESTVLESLPRHTSISLRA
jgi:hypothetical protein